MTMSASYFDLLKYAATGQASPDMTYYDKMRASTLMGGATVQTLTGIPPLSFPSDGSPITIWSMKGNGQQTGTPTPDNPVMPDFVGVRTGNMFDKAAVTFNYYVRDSDGTLRAYSGLNATDYIDISGFSALYLKYFTSETATGQWAAFYDASKNYISGIIGYNRSVTIPNNAVYIRLTVDNNYMDLFSVSVTSLDEYEPFGYKTPLTCAGQTVPVYLGQVSTVRRVKKLVLTGEEDDWRTSGSGAAQIFNHTIGLYVDLQPYAICNMFRHVNNAADYSNSFDIVRSSSNGVIRFNNSGIATTVTDWKSYLAQQNAAGNPVTVWYVLAEPETGIVNEPLAKIGDYADELHSTDAGIIIPTAKGENTLTVDTPIQPSKMTITFKG